MIISVNINWSPIICTDCESCVCSTRVSFREQGSDTWITPFFPTNPTQHGYYTLEISSGVYYQVRLTFIGPQCNQKDTFISLFYPDEQCCPEDFTLAPDGTYCYKIEDIDATIVGSPATLVAVHATAYSTCGSYIYNTGWNINGTGASTQITTANAFWVNGAGTCVDATTTNGPLNRTGVWSSGTPGSGQDIGFGVCINLPETKTYYIGIASDNYSIIKLDGIIRLNQDPVALATQYGVGVAATFKVWHIYPIVMNAGPHILELSGHNVLGAAAIGCEVYDATSADIIAATSYSVLGPKLIFSSKDYIGQDVQLGTGGAGYTCPDDYLIAPCTDPIKCRKITPHAVISC